MTVFEKSEARVSWGMAKMIVNLMPKHHSYLEPFFGSGAAAEVKRLFPKKKHAIIALGCGKNVLYEWSCGVAPSAVYLARLHELGADVIWILTGRRAK